MYNSTIAGQTDFLYGFGTLWIQSSLLSLRGCGGGITAWKGSNTTFVNHYGVYIHDSDVVKANSTLNITGKCALGRPWNAQHRSIFVDTYLDDSIRPSGYIQWSATDPRVNYSKCMIPSLASRMLVVYHTKRCRYDRKRLKIELTITTQTPQWPSTTTSAPAST